MWWLRVQQVLEARVDHTRVVDILRKADHLPLVKDYLLAVQKSNLAAVNEAENGLLIEEEDFAALRDSITTYDNFDQLSLASRLEMHELMEFRRISAFIYKKALRWRKAVALAKQDGLYKVLFILFTVRTIMTVIFIRIGGKRQARMQWLAKPVNDVPEPQIVIGHT